MSYFSNYLLKQTYSNTASTCAGSSKAGSQCTIVNQDNHRKTSKPSSKKACPKAPKIRGTKTCPATCIPKPSSGSKPRATTATQGRQWRIPFVSPSTSVAYTQKRPNHATNNTPKLLSSNTSDELVNAFTLKKKNHSSSYKSSFPQASSPTTAAVKALSVKLPPFKSAVNFKTDRVDIIKEKGNKEKVNSVQKSASMNDTGSSHHPRPQSAGKVKPVVVQEGPIELSNENFNLNKILTEAKPLELEQQLLKCSPSSPFLPQAANPENETRKKAESVSTARIHSRLYQNRLQLPLFSSSIFPTLFPVQHSDSDMWGTVRQSASCTDRNSIPSLTSLPQWNEEIDGVVPDENASDEIMNNEHEQFPLDENQVPVKENVSVIQILKNTILSNFGFFNSYRDSNNNIVVDNINETDSACTLAEEMLNAACAENIVVDIDELIRISHDHVYGERVNSFSNGTTEEIPAPITPFTESNRSTTPLSNSSDQESVPFPREIEKQLHNPAKGKNILPFTCQVQPQRQNLLADVLEEDENENLVEKLSSTRLKIKVSDLGISPPPSIGVKDEEELEKNDDEEYEECIFHDVDSRLISTATSFVSICNEGDDDEEEQEESNKTSVQEVNFSKQIGKSEKQTKLDRLVMAINTGVDIMPENKPMLKGIMKAGTEKSTISQSVLTENAYLEKSDKAETPPSVTSNSEIRRRAIKEKISFPVTYSQVGADYGFPSKISVSQVFKKFEELTSADSSETFPAKLSTIDEETEEDRVISDTELDLKTPANDEEEEFLGIMDSVCEYINAGLNYATGLIGNESDLEPREDVMLYNGYRIRVRGRRLLLESLHVNCDFTVDNNGTFNRTRSTPSYVALRPHTYSREQLEESCEGRRIRIIIRVTDPIRTKKCEEIQQQCQELNKCLGDTPAEGDGMNRDNDQKKEAKERKISSRHLKQLEHGVRKENGKWIFSIKNSESGRESHPNFVEIGCPLGVHPETIVYGIINGLLLIEAP